MPLLAFALLPMAAGDAAVDEPGWLVFMSGDDRLAVRGDQVQVSEPLQDDTGWKAMLTFDTQGAAAFADLTGRHVGDRMEARLCGEVVIAATVMERIEGGSVAISLADGEPSSRRLAALRNKDCKND